eukprot:jgi/Orpsp1_1/1179408/evm.model.c7180000069214.1
MNFKSIALINTLISLVSAGIGSINDFKDYPGIVDLINANTKGYKTNFKYTFTDGPIYSGDGTAYGDATSGGNCLFPKEEYYDDMLYAALNNKQYNEDMGCGLCAVVVSTSNPYKAIRVRIIDQCPECEHGSLDFSDKAFKALSNMDPARIKITWALIPCDIDVNEFPALLKKDSPIKFQFKTGTTEFWGEVEVYNTRYPVAKVEFLKDGSYIDLNRRAYNYWTIKTGGFGNAPYTFRVTLADDTVIEAKDVEMVIPSGDEGDEYSTGTQTIIQQGITSDGSNSGGYNGDSNNTPISNDNDNLCPKSITSQGYKCCEQGNCDIYYNDEAGDWGVSSTDLDWCGIRTDCTETENKISNDDTCKEIPDYGCCESCDVVLTDEDARWGVENNDWCVIRDSC